MRGMRIGLFALLMTATSGLMAADPAKLSVVNYDQLSQSVHRQKGKVVLVDFWFDACVPCKKGFPRLLALQQKYREHGLVVITVNVDDPMDAATCERVRAFLTTQKATAIHLQLDAKPEVWTAKLGVSTLPALFLFDRDGRLLRKWSDTVDYDQVEQRLAIEMKSSEK